MKQQILEFPVSHPLENISIITNNRLFVDDFNPSHLISPNSISGHNCHVLNKNDDAVN